MVEDLGVREENEVTPKVVATGGGAGVGYAVGLILVYCLQALTGDVPVRIEDAMVRLVTVAPAGAAGWVKSE